MDVMLLYLPVHVLIVHAPDALLVPLQRGVDGYAACVLEGVGKAHVGGGMDQHLLSGGGKGLDGGADAPQHAVFVADVLRQQALHGVSPLLPADDAVEIFLGQGEVAEVGHLHTPVYGIHDCRRRLEAHVRYPHGDGGEALVHLEVLERYHVRRRGVPAPPVQDGGKIVFHMYFLFISVCGTGPAAATGP